MCRIFFCNPGICIFWLSGRGFLRVWSKHLVICMICDNSDTEKRWIFVVQWNVTVECVSFDWLDLLSSVCVLMVCVLMVCVVMVCVWFAWSFVSFSWCGSYSVSVGWMMCDLSDFVLCWWRCVEMGWCRPRSLRVDTGHQLFQLFVSWVLDVLVLTGHSCDLYLDV